MFSEVEQWGEFFNQYRNIFPFNFISRNLSWKNIHAKVDIPSIMWLKYDLEIKALAYYARKKGLSYVKTFKVYSKYLFKPTPWKGDS